MALNHFEETSQSQWLHLIHAAQTHAGYQFSDELKQYLILTLQHYTTELTLTDSIITVDYMKALHQSGSQQSHELRNIGDQCLLLTGLFPERIEQKNVSLDYIITVGKQSYLHIALEHHLPRFNNELFHDLEEHFVGLADTLYLMRHIDNQK